VTLTDAGVLFQQRAQEIIDLMDKTSRDIADQNDLVGGTVSIGCVESCVSRMLPEVLKEFSALHPKVGYELYSADGDDIREKLDRGELDFGILVEPVEAAKYDYLRLPYWETWGVLMRKDDPLAENGDHRKRGYPVHPPDPAAAGDRTGQYRGLVWGGPESAEHFLQS